MEESYKTDSLASFRGKSSEKAWYIQEGAKLNDNLVFEPRHGMEFRYDGKYIYTINGWKITDKRTNEVIHGIAYIGLTPNKSIDVFNKDYDFTGDFATQDAWSYQNKYHDLCQIEYDKERQKDYEDHKRIEAERLKAKEMHKEELRTSFYGYLANRSELQQERIFSLLNKKYTNGKTTAYMIENMVVLGYELTHGKYNGKKKEEYWFYDASRNTDHFLSKTEYDYALFLRDKLASVDKKTILFRRLVIRRQSLENINGLKKISLSGLDMTIEDQKEAKKKEIAIRTFQNINPLSKFPSCTYNELKTGYVIPQYDTESPSFLYNQVTKVEKDYYYTKFCDEFGNSVNIGGSASPHFKGDKGDKTVHYFVPKDKTKAKIIGKETICGEEFDIYDRTDDNVQMKNYDPTFCAAQTEYHAVYGIGAFGFVKIKNIVCIPVPPDEDEIKDLAATRDAIFENSDLKMFPDANRDKTFNVKAVLKRNFPDTSFKVTSDYSSLNIYWTDGPTERKVEDAIFMFRKADYSQRQVDYYEYRHTPLTRMFGGYDYTWVKRGFSEEQTDRIKKMFPLLDTNNDVHTYRDHFLNAYPDWQNMIKDEYGVTLKLEDICDSSWTHSVSYRGILNLIDLSGRKEEKKKTPKAKLSPLEKKIREIVGTGNIIAPYKGGYAICKEPDKEDWYFWPTHYSQYTKKHEKMEKLRSIGFECSTGGNRYGGVPIAIENYPQMMAKVAEEHKKLGIPMWYNPYSLSALRVLRLGLKNHNHNKEIDLNNKQYLNTEH